MKPNEAFVNRKLLIVGGNTASQANLSQIFQSLGCKVWIVENESKAIEAIKSEIQIDMVVLEIEAPISSAIEFVRNIRVERGELPAVFIVSDCTDPQFDAAYFEGVDAVFVRPLAAEELERGIAFSYAEALENDKRKHQRKRIRRARVLYEFDWKEVTGYATNFSLGGMFVGSMGEIPDKGQTIKFKLSIEDRDEEELSGFAVVKWSRPKLSYGRPRGFGAEFVGLSEVSQKKLKHLIAGGASAPATKKDEGTTK